MDLGPDDPGQTGAPPPQRHAPNPAVGGPDHADLRAGDPQYPPRKDSAGAAELADRLRSQGVVVVAGQALAGSRPEGVDLLGALPVLASELAAEWRDAADWLPMLSPNRLQLRSAAAVLTHAAVTAEADAVAAPALDLAAVARAAALRAGLRPPEATDSAHPDSGQSTEATAALDRTWAVLCDLRALLSGGPLDSRSLSVVPSAAVVAPEQGRALGPALHRAACAGALVGLLGAWLPPSRPDPVATADQMLEAVSSLARRPEDQAWWAALVTLGRVAASLSVAAHFAVARHSGPGPEAAALVVSEPALAEFVDQALAAVRGSSDGGAEPVTPATDPPTTDRPSMPPQASPSQQARAAAERAAAERRATQQAFMERAQATRAARAARPDAASTAEPAVLRPDVVAMAPTGQGRAEPEPEQEETGPGTSPPDSLGPDSLGPDSLGPDPLGPDPLGAGPLEPTQEIELRPWVWDTLMRPR